MTTLKRAFFPPMPRGRRDQRRYIERPKSQGLLGRAIIEAFRKLDPRLTVRNPVMFVVWCGTVVTLAATVEPQLFGLSADDPGRGFNGALAAILVFTPLFANLAEALAEGRGKAQADALRRTQARTQAWRLLPDGSEALVDSSSLRKGDQVQVSSGELIPADGEVVAGVAANALGASGLSEGVTTATTVAGVGVSAIDLTTAAGAQAALFTVDSAINTVNSTRAALGAYQARFTSVVASLATTAENLTASRSRIQDADFAAETANLSRSQILQQAGTAMVAQANQLPQGVLALLRQ